MKVISSDNHGVLHLGGDDDTLEDTATDRDVAGERALLVDVVALNGSLWGLETKADALVVSVALK